MIGFKRSTYYLCVVLVDSFMAQIDNVQVNRLQLIGVSCLISAAKNEVSLLDIRFNRDLAKVEARIREWTFLTIYEMQEGIRYARLLHQTESEVVNNA